MPQPRVLVTGATGLVGSAIVRALLERTCPVRVLVRSSERARALFGSSAEISVGDLRDAASLRPACAGIAQIYHVAGAVDTHRHGDAEILDTNVDGTRRLLEAALAARVRRVVYTSSVSVYGDRLPLGVAEDAPVNPAGIYGASKVRAEQLAQDAVAAGLHVMIVRPCIVYGSGDRYFMPQAVQVARLPVIPLPDGGRHVVDLVHADDLAAAHLLVMEAGQSGVAYNVTDGGCHHAGDLIRWVAEGLHRSPWLPSIPWWFAACIRPLINVVGRACGRPDFAHFGRQELDGLFSDYHFDISKIAALGYAARIAARAGLRSELQRSIDASGHACRPA
ncbi:MAG TPA: NAD-dependent epimerase/dehydratase family protein [bacterium]|nr:NAD-dependent epimerase/dehydratase family protein [bacterium]